MIPESCEIRIDRRVVPGEDPDQVLRVVEDLLEELRRSHPRLKVSQGDASIDPALDPKGGEAFIEFVQGALDTMGLPSTPEGVLYATDGSNLDASGVPTVVLGPGNIAQAHTRDEWLELKQLHKAVEVYAQLMRKPLKVI